MKLKPDAALRRKFFVPESFQHPAKMHAGLLWEIVERYTQPGQWILDPMGGSGTTLLAALMGRNVCIVEMEEHFLTPMRESWAKMRQQVMLGATLGQVVILRGDARCLPLGRADCVVTSPPWEQTLSQGGDLWKYARDGGTYGDLHRAKSNAAAWSSYTRPAAVITSPPYEDSHIAQSSDGEANRRFRDGNYQGDALKGMGLSKGYTRPVDAVVTSPPYADSDVAQLPGSRGGQLWVEGGRAAHVQINLRYGATQAGDNIGNLRGEKYWEAMRLIYAECHRVLQPGGVMVLVVKGYTRDGQYVDLPQQTVDCCEALGFNFVERWERQLWALSFWRILQQRRDPAAFDNQLRFEAVLVLESK